MPPNVYMNHENFINRSYFLIVFCDLEGHSKITTTKGVHVRQVISLDFQ